MRGGPAQPRLLCILLMSASSLAPLLVIPRAACSPTGGTLPHLEGTSPRVAASGPGSVGHLSAFEGRPQDTGRTPRSTNTMTASGSGVASSKDVSASTAARRSLRPSSHPGVRVAKRLKKRRRQPSATVTNLLRQQEVPVLDPDKGLLMSAQGDETSFPSSPRGVPTQDQDTTALGNGTPSVLSLPADNNLENLELTLADLMEDDSDPLLEDVIEAMNSAPADVSTNSAGGLLRGGVDQVRGKVGVSVRAAPAVAKTPWCAKNKEWWTDNTTSTRNARFEAYGCLKISGIHTAQTYLKTVVVIDRTDATNTYLKLPSTGQNSYGEELTLTNIDPLQPAEERALDVKSNVFCSAGQLMPDGTLLSIGGSSDASNADPLLNGSYAIRAFTPCGDKTCDFKLVGDMTSKRWYPTAQIMPDGRVLIVGGADVFGNIAINTLSKNNPTIEYWPRKQGEKQYYLDFLVRTVPFNLYAFVHVLPSGFVFMFTANEWILFDSVTNTEVQGRKTPPLDVVDEKGVPIFRQYPVAGSSAMFPLTSKNNWTAEIMICGGNNARAVLVNGDGGRSAANGKIPADYNCWRITPEAPDPVWTKEVMCNYPKCDVMLRRVMPDMVVLADGSVLIVNGAEQGYEGLKQSYANVPQLQPLIYNPYTHKWYPTANLPKSKVPRVYHSSALLLHDTTVLISGSNPNPYLWTGGGFPTEFRMERFIPPYLTTNHRRPILFKAPKAIAVNKMFTIYFNTTQKSNNQDLTKRFKVSIVYPGFATHNQRHGMRHIDLDILSVLRTRQVTYIANVRSPPNVNIGIPTMYWIHVLDEGVPNVEGLPINLTRSGTTKYNMF